MKRTPQEDVVQALTEMIDNEIKLGPNEKHRFGVSLELYSNLKKDSRFLEINGGLEYRGTTVVIDEFNRACIKL